MAEYIWIYLHLDKTNVLYTAHLMMNNDVIDSLGGSYPSFFATEIDSRKKWGSLIPVHTSFDFLKYEEIKEFI